MYVCMYIYLYIYIFIYLYIYIYNIIYIHINLKVYIYTYNLMRYMQNGIKNAFIHYVAQYSQNKKEILILIEFNYLTLFF